MSAHTPGPWVAALGEFEFTNAGQRPVVQLVADDKLPVHIAYVSAVADRKRSTPYNAPDPERDANARVIAAAPELLAFVQACETACARVLEEGVAVYAGVDFAALHSGARAAIAKAVQP